MTNTTIMKFIVADKYAVTCIERNDSLDNFRHNHPACIMLGSYLCCYASVGQISRSFRRYRRRFRHLFGQKQIKDAGFQARQRNKVGGNRICCPDTYSEYDLLKSAAERLP